MSLSRENWIGLGRMFIKKIVIEQSQVGFEMLFWGLAGFVNPEDYHEKAGLGADGLAELARVDEHDEFFKDNAIEVTNCRVHIISK